MKSGASKKKKKTQPRKKEKSQMPAVPKAKHGKKQQVEQNLPAASLQMQKASGISCFKSHEGMHWELSKKYAFFKLF